MTYMILVEDASAPKVFHPTYASAQMEAERLAQLPHNKGKTIHVLKVVSSLRPVWSFVWEHRAEQRTDGQIGAEILAREFARRQEGADF